MRISTRSRGRLLRAFLLVSTRALEPTALRHRPPRQDLGCLSGAGGAVEVLPYGELGHVRHLMVPNYSCTMVYTYCGGVH